MNIKCFVFSSKDQYDTTIKLEQKLRRLVDTKVINVDESITNANWINVSQFSSFADQLQFSIANFDDFDYDAFCFVDPATEFNDWSGFFLFSQEEFSNYVNVVDISDKSVWIIHKKLVRQINQSHHLGNNRLNGWDFLLSIFEQINTCLVSKTYD